MHERDINIYKSVVSQCAFVRVNRRSCRFCVVTEQPIHVETFRHKSKIVITALLALAVLPVLAQPADSFLGTDGKYHPSGSFVGEDGKYHSKAEFLGQDGKYHHKGAFLGDDGKYHYQGSFLGEDGEYHRKGSFLGEDDKHYPQGRFLGEDNKYHTPDSIRDEHGR